MPRLAVVLLTVTAGLIVNTRQIIEGLVSRCRRRGADWSRRRPASRLSPSAGPAPQNVRRATHSRKSESTIA